MRPADVSVVGTCMICRKPVLNIIDEPYVACECLHPLSAHAWHTECASNLAEQHRRTFFSTCDVCKVKIHTEDTNWLPDDTWSLWMTRVAGRWTARIALLVAVVFATSLLGGYVYKLYVSTRSILAGNGMPHEFALWGLQYNMTLHTGWHPGRKHMTLGFWLGFKVFIFCTMAYFLWWFARLVLFPPLRWLFSKVRVAAFGQRYKSVVTRGRPPAHRKT